MLTITVDHNSKTPIYKQIFDQIVHHISIGELRPDSYLPASRTMAGILDVNFHTVNKAYDILRDQGIIALSRNRKYVVMNSTMNERSLHQIEEKEREIIDEAFAKGFNEKEINTLIAEIIKSRKRKYKEALKR